MLPSHPSHKPSISHQPPSNLKGATAPVPHAADDLPPRPIGPERLRALREAILNGTYPMEAAVTQGLISLFRSPAPPPPPGSGSMGDGPPGDGSRRG